jgi:hypothetical protein
MSPKNIDDPTLLVVETRNGSCAWSEPGDIDISRGLKIGPQPLKEIGGIHRESLRLFHGGRWFPHPNSVPSNVMTPLSAPREANESIRSRSRKTKEPSAEDSLPIAAR